MKGFKNCVGEVQSRLLPVECASPLFKDLRFGNRGVRFHLKGIPILDGYSHRERIHTNLTHSQELATPHDQSLVVIIKYNLWKGLEFRV